MTETDDEMSRFLGLCVERLSGPDGERPESEVVRALAAYPAAIRPVYSAITGDRSPVVGRLQMLSEIVQRVRPVKRK